MKKLTLLGIVILFNSCKKDTNNIPNVPVNINIYLSDPQWFDLYHQGGFAYVTGGSQGIFIYRVNQDQFVAFDRHCPYQPNNNCRAAMDTSTNLNLVDTCCNTLYQLNNGQAIGGPGTMPLKNYLTTFDGDLLTIRN